jgi:mycoredoxin
MRRWALTFVELACGAAATVAVWASGRTGLAVALFVIFVILGVLASPRAFPRSTSAAEAQASSAADGRAIVYWRPGCPFCLRLRGSLGRDAAKLHWVDIWADPAGAAAVRAVTGGDETVPTVVAGSGSWVNPAPALVRELARSGS